MRLTRDANATVAGYAQWVASGTHPHAVIGGNRRSARGAIATTLRRARDNHAPARRLTAAPRALLLMGRAKTRRPRGQIAVRHASGVEHLMCRGVSLTFSRAVGESASRVATVRPGAVGMSDAGGILC